MTQGRMPDFTARCAVGLLGMAAHIKQHAVRYAVAVALLVFAPTRGTGQSVASSFVLRNGTVIDVRAGRALPNRDIVVSGNRIAAVYPTGQRRAPAGARIVDVRGKYIIPGMIDTHVHLVFGWASQPADSLETLAWIVANGITSVRDMGGVGFRFDSTGRLAGGTGLPSGDARPRLHAATEAGQILGPRIYVSAGPNPADSTSWPAFLKSIGTTDTSEAIRRFPSLGLSGVKVQNIAPAAMLRLVAQAKAAKMPVYGHSTYRELDGRFENLTMALVRAGIEGIAHFSGMTVREGPDTRDLPTLSRTTPEGRRAWRRFNQTGAGEKSEAETKALIDSMVARGVWLEPTLVLNESNRGAHAGLVLNKYFVGVRPTVIDDDAEITVVKEQNAQRERAFLRRFYEVGGMIVTGTDALGTPIIPIAPLGVAEEMRLLTLAGIPPIGALQAATINAARALHWDDRIGTIEPQKLADLVVLDSDPMRDIGAVKMIHAVISNGRILDRTRLDEIMARTGTPRKPRP